MTMTGMDSISRTTQYVAAHPKGDFPGKVASITQKTAKNGSVYWEIVATTQYGNAPKLLVWGATDFEVRQAMAERQAGNPQKFESLQRRVNMVRGLLVRLGGFEEAVVNQMSFSQLIGKLATLIGANTLVRVSEWTKNDGSKQASTFLDKTDNQTGPTTVLTTTQPQASQQPQDFGQPAPQESQPTPQQAQPQTYQQPSYPGPSNLDDIPF